MFRQTNTEYVKIKWEREGNIQILKESWENMSITMEHDGIHSIKSGQKGQSMSNINSYFL